MKREHILHTIIVCLLIIIIVLCAAPRKADFKIVRYNQTTTTNNLPVSCYVLLTPGHAPQPAGCVLDGNDAYFPFPQPTPGIGEEG